MADSLDEYIARSKKQQPITLRIVNKVIKALNEANNPIVSVFDGVDETKVTPGNKKEIHRLVFNLDECYLYTQSGGWVRLVMENDWDCLVDYTISLEDILKPVNDYIEKWNG
jgi:hypothetical protein